MNVFLRVAVTVAVMTMMVALVAGCGESKAQKEKNARAETVARGLSESKVQNEAERAAAQPFTGWYTDNPAASVFNISTAEQLLGLAQLVNGGNGFSGKTITLANDIDLSVYGKGSAFNDGKGWIPIGNSKDRLFTGMFDGNGKKIRGLYINDTTLEYAGLFGCVGDTVKNLGVENASITGGDNVGGVVGSIDRSYWRQRGIRDFGYVVNCHFTGAINGNDNVGGVAGSCAYGTVIGSHSTGTIIGNSRVGGVVGNVAGGAIIGNYSTGTVNGIIDVGGVAGRVGIGVDLGHHTGDYGYGGIISLNYNTGAVTGRDYVGGVVGIVASCSTAGNYSTGAVTGNDYVGGVAGGIIGGAKRCVDCDCEDENPVYCWYTGSTVTDCAALNPSVKGKGSNVGRVVGEIANENGTISKNIAFSALTNASGNTNWSNKGADAKDGEDITAEEIRADGTIGARFVGKPWAIENGKLPGVRGKAVDMPVHLR